MKVLHSSGFGDFLGLISEKLFKNMKCVGFYDANELLY